MEPSSAELDRELSRLAERQRRARLRFAIAALIAAGLFGAVWLWQRRAGQQAIAGAWEEAGGCLLGGALPDHEAPSPRLRGIKLAAAQLDKEWPGRCLDTVVRLHDVVAKHGDREEPLALHADALAAGLREGKGDDALAYPLDELVAAGRARGLSTEALVRPVQPPPRPVEPMNVSTLPETARLSEGKKPTLRTETWPGVDLHLLIQDEGWIVCTFTRGGPAARCRTIAGEAAEAAELSLRGTSEADAAPLLFETVGAETRVYRSESGALVSGGAIQTGYVAKDGYVALTTDALDDDIGNFELLQQHKPGGALERVTIHPDELAPRRKRLIQWSALFGLLVVQVVGEVSETDEKPDEEEEKEELPHLLWQRLPADDVLAKFTDAGVLDWVNAPLSTCQTAETIVLRLGSDRGYLTFFDDGAWSKPGFVEHLETGLRCRRKEVLIGGLSVCSKVHCQHVAVEPARFKDLVNEETVEVVLGDKMLAVGRMANRNGLRYVLGAGEVELLFDDMLRKGVVQVNSTLGSMQLFWREDFAVLTLLTDAGLHAVYFDKDGKAQPVEVSRD